MYQYLNQIILPNQETNPYVVGYNGNTWQWIKNNEKNGIGCKISELQDGLYLLKIDDNTIIVFEYLNKTPYVISTYELPDALDINYSNNNVYIPAEEKVKLTGLIFKEFEEFSEPTLEEYVSIDSEENIKIISLTSNSPIQHASVGYGSAVPNQNAPYTIYIQTGVTTSG